MFGWIITGVAGSASSSLDAQMHQATVGDSLSSPVRRFWEQEDLPDAASPWTVEEQQCENHFVATHSRTPDERYQRFKRDEDFHTLYCDFVKQYEELGHMSLAKEPPTGNQAHYLPHHGVLKPSSSTTKLRVVFNGSWSEPSQPSLNDRLHVGPNLLPLLADVLLRWRKHQFVVTADVTKMYQQILVQPEDRDFQRILWREKETQRMSEYRLNTVTYGMSCAPYLAVRTLHQLAADEGSRYPIDARAIKQEAYVDNILTGANSIPALEEAAIQLHQTDDTHSPLGLQWAPHDDSFRFAISDAAVQPPTKRGVVSQSA
ncbi:uncharacterized protein LOC143353821 [Halictus rubicundus]|uniref:uncharacterized protein LOC143353821 n=1 Tax=Halictus rubicundus TaxID=77578 RepID=UPI004035E57D